MDIHLELRIFSFYLIQLNRILESMKTIKIGLQLFVFAALMSCEGEENLYSYTESSGGDDSKSSAMSENNLKVIQAIGGDGRNVDWQALEKEYNASMNDEYGPDFYYNDCSEGVNLVQVSSFLKDQGGNSYGGAELNNTPVTAWVEGKPDYGIGEYFICKGFCPNTIYNGYQKSPSAWRNNSRVKRLKLYVNEEPYAFIDLTDEMGVQYFDGPRGEPEGDDEFKFEIVDVYEGDKWSDVAISKVAHVVCCFGSETEILDLNGVGKKLNSNAEIMTVNVQTGVVSSGTIEKISHQKHVGVYEVKTKNHSIRITKNHPLYFEHIGFSSIQRINPADLTRADQYPRVLTMDKNNQLIYETIIEVAHVAGLVETSTIRKISNKQNYLANGFVSKPY